MKIKKYDTVLILAAFIRIHEQVNQASHFYLVIVNLQFILAKLQNECIFLVSSLDMFLANNSASQSNHSQVISLCPPLIHISTPQQSAKKQLYIK